MRATRCIVLDAMGVIFSAADDVAELLIPFVAQSGGATDAEVIEAAYLKASLGTIDASTFWREVGLNPSFEDMYLSGHSLVEGVDAFLHRAERQDIPVWCLSNDVGRWSRKLRAHFGIERFLTGAVISSDVRVRKPAREIYEILLGQSGFQPDELFFVDDRKKNVDAATALGITAAQFDLKTGFRCVAEAVFQSTDGV